jgi:hypothetical protein
MATASNKGDPWEHRKSVPVWRGTIWWSNPGAHDDRATSVNDLIKINWDLYNFSHRPGQKPVEVAVSRIVAVQCVYPCDLTRLRVRTYMHERT